MHNLQKVSDMKILDEFKYIVFSTKSISLFDLRYHSIPISQFPLNINYSEIGMKKNFNIESELVNYIGIDTSRKDTSVLLFETLENFNYKNEEFFSEFIDVRLFDTTKEVCDSSGLIYGDVFINFSADVFGGLYSTIHNVINTTDFTQNSAVTKIDSNLRNISEAGKIDTYVDQDKDHTIVSLFEKFQLENHFKKEKIKIEKIKYVKNNINYNEDLGNNYNSDELSSLSDENSLIEKDEENIKEENNDFDFGTANVNGVKKKMFKIQNKRNVVEKLIQDGEKNIIEKFIRQGGQGNNSQKYFISSNDINDNEINVKQSDDMMVDEGLEDIDEHEKLRYVNNLMNQNDGEMDRDNSSGSEAEKDMDWLFDMLEDKTQANGNYIYNNKFNNK
jgi:hypothetical protein